jgi:hypothetical protein
VPCSANNPRQEQTQMDTEKREKLDQDAKELFERTNKSGEPPMEDFKLGIDVLDKNVARIDNGVRKIAEKVHNLVDKK